MKKLISLFLAIMMVLSLASVASAEEYVQLTWAQGTGATAPIDNDQVLEALNVISREKLGVEVKIDYFTNDQLQTSINTGEVYDMYFTCGWYNHFNTCVANGLFADIADKVKEWTPDLYATLPEYVWEMAKSTNGALYALPIKKDFAPINQLVYDLGFYESIDMVPPASIEKLSELTPYLAAWKEAYPDRYPMTIGGGPAGIDTTFDFIDRTVNIGVSRAVDGTQENTTVISEFEDPVILDRLHTLREWYQAGYVNPDAPTLTETSIDTKGEDGNHWTWTQAWHGYDWSTSREFKAGVVNYSGPYLSTDGVQGSMTGFSVTLEDDLERFELALKYQELLNTDLQYRDTLRYGIEGTHFNYVEVKDAEGNVLGNGVMRTALGSDNYNPWAFSQGSYSLSSIEVSEKNLTGEYATPVLDQWDQYFAAVETAPVSKIAGFAFDASNWTSQFAEITAIKDEYWNDLVCGAVDTDTAIAEMMEKMNAAGLQDIIADAQAQLDAYLASKAE